MIAITTPQADQISPSKWNKPVATVFQMGSTLTDLASILEGNRPYFMGAPDRVVTANQLTWQFSFGTNNNLRVFDNKSGMGGWILRADYVVDALNDATSRALDGNYGRVDAGRDLLRESQDVIGIAKFASDFVIDAAGRNPARAFQGSISGSATPGKPIEMNGAVYVPVTLQLWDINGAKSATHYPIMTTYNSLIPQDNPNGAHAPLNSLYTFYFLRVLVPATGVPWEATPSQGYKR